MTQNLHKIHYQRFHNKVFLILTLEIFIKYVSKFKNTFESFQIINVILCNLKYLKLFEGPLTLLEVFPESKNVERVQCSNDFLKYLNLFERTLTLLPKSKNILGNFQKAKSKNEGRVIARK